MPTSTTASAKLATVDPVWERIRTEAEAATRADTSLGGFLFTSVLNPSSFEEALCHRLAQRLGNADIGAELIVQGFEAMALGGGAAPEVLSDRFSLEKRRVRALRSEGTL